MRGNGETLEFERRVGGGVIWGRDEGCGAVALAGMSRADARVERVLEVRLEPHLKRSPLHSWVRSSSSCPSPQQRTWVISRDTALRSLASRITSILRGEPSGSLSHSSSARSCRASDGSFRIGHTLCCQSLKKELKEGGQLAELSSKERSGAEMVGGSP